jgi:hypothetical protein
VITQTGSVAVASKPNWLNGWFLKVCARPFVAVDGAEYPGSLRAHGQR